MAKSENLYRDRDVARILVRDINEYSGKPLKLMEVCGSHTMAISKFGIRGLLPDRIRLISGPGCPVCVTPDYFVRAAVELSQREDIIIATFGDMMRIPAGDTSLLEQKAKGRDIRIVYSPLDCIAMASDNKHKKVVFLSVGFETTIPVVALSIIKAESSGADNYMLLTANKTIPAALELLSADEEIGVDGYIYPGHVSAIIGDRIYRAVAGKYGIPGVITGFEPSDILGGILKLVKLIEAGDARVDNFYSRVVRSEGNANAVACMMDVFEECDAVWRGIGWIPGSGLKLREKYAGRDAWNLLGKPREQLGEEPKGCRCGDILKGKCLPSECGLFGKSCTPENPVGSCMVSSEGTCAAYFRYR